MMYRCYFLCCLLLLSCNSNTIFKEPKDLIPRDTMVMLLTDMYISVSARNIKNKFKEKKNSYMPLVYEKYKIDSNRFYSSNRYYTSNIEPNKGILEEVKGKIKVQLDSFQRQLDVKDSIKKAGKELRKEKRRIRDSIRNRKKDSIKNLKKD